MKQINKPIHSPKRLSQFYFQIDRDKKRIYAKENPNYQTLLQRKEWIDFRKRILERDDFKCQSCGNSNNLQIHHKQYHFSESKMSFLMPWEYAQHLLISLCESCHTAGHQIPTKIIK